MTRPMTRPMIRPAVGAALTATGGSALSPVVPVGALFPTLAVAVVVPTVLVVAFRSRRLALLGAMCCWPVLGVCTALAVGGRGDLLTAALDAPRTLLTGSLPIEVTPGLVLWLFSVFWWAAYWTARADGQAIALLPPTLLLAAATAAAVPAAHTRALQVWVATAFTVLAALLLGLRSPGGHLVRVADGTGGHLVRVAGALTIGLVAVPIAGLLPIRAHPLDPRDAVTAPRQSRQLLSPLAEADRWAAGPAEPLFRIRSAETLPLRLTILDGYDGQEWTSSAVYTAAGPELSLPASGQRTHRVTTDVELQSLNTPWLPAPDRPIALTGVPAVVERADGLLAAPAGQPSNGLHYRVVSEVPQLSQSSASQAGPATGAGFAPYRTVPHDVPPTLLRSAEEITAQAESPYRQLLLLQNSLRDGHHYQASATPGRTVGHLVFFYQKSKVGTADQFAATFAIMARHLGFPTRLAIGFAPTGRPGPDGWSQVVSTDVMVWPEVALRGLGWVPFYPVPAPGGAQESGVAEPRTRAALDQVLLAKASHKPTPTNAVTPPRDRVTPHRSRWGFWPYVLVCPVLLLAYPVGVSLVRFVGRRRMRSRPPEAQISTAWQVSVTELSRLGHPRLASLTPDETAAYARTRLGEEAGRTMATLAGTLADTVYSPRSPNRTDAEAAWTAAGRLRADVGTAIGRRGRIRRAMELPHLGGSRQ